MKKIILCLLVLLAAFAPHAQAQNTFRNGDILEMRLSGPPEEFTREFNLVLSVDEGAITVPLIGRVAATGMTSSALAASIERKLKDAKIFTIANVNINTSSHKERLVIVGG